MREVKAGGWFRKRSYPHFDYPKTYEQAVVIASNAKIIPSHSFLPFIGYTDKKRTFKTDNSDRSIPKRLRPRIRSTKPREIKYASHTDSCIFAYYAHKLQDLYETYLNSQHLSDHVTGYRSNKGSNIDFAAEAFSEVQLRGSAVAICCDISDFFPSIDHSNLKYQLQSVLGSATLSDDWYAVFKAMTKFAWIEQQDLYELESIDARCPPRPLVLDIADTMNRARAKKLIKKNSSTAGIPQGSPISAVMANVSMIDFDRALKEWASTNSAFYRRYSDDILLIVDKQHEQAAINVIEQQSKNPGLNLIIKAEKTEISRFSPLSNGQIIVDRPFTYLGFTFDGTNVELRARTLSRYHRRMTYATRASARGAKKAGSGPDRAFKRSLIRDFTHLGRANFYAYARRIDAKILNARAKNQLKNHFKILIRKLTTRGR